MVLPNRENVNNLYSWYNLITNRKNFVFRYTNFIKI